MRKELVALAAGMFLALPATVRSETTQLKPWVPHAQQSLTLGAIATGVVMQVPNSQAAAIPLIHFSTSQPAFALNHLKGDFGERMMDAAMTKRLLRVTGGWSIATPARTGRSGIDGLYFKLDSDGNFRDLLVADAKYGTATLDVLKDGTKQMSREWIQPRLDHTARMYSALARQVDNTIAGRANGAAKNAASNRITIPINEQTSADIWKTPGGLRYFCSDKAVSTADIQRQLNRAALYLEEAAAGSGMYRPGLFSYTASGREHVITFSTLDANAKVVGFSQVKGTFAQLPVEFQKTVQSQVRRTLLAAGKSRDEVRVLTADICNDAEKFNRICMQPRHSYMAGLDTKAIGVAGTVGVAGMGLDALFQYWERGELDVGRVVTTGALATGSAVVGNYVGTQASLLLGSYSPALGQYGGAILGGGVGSTIFSYGLYAAGYIDGRAAHTGTIVGVMAPALYSVAYGMAYSGSMAIALSYGTAGTGGGGISLGGAAAKKEGAGWLGGGTAGAAGGGGGPAGGGVVFFRGRRAYGGGASGCNHGRRL